MNDDNKRLQEIIDRQKAANDKIAAEEKARAEANAKAHNIGKSAKETWQEILENLESSLKDWNDRFKEVGVSFSFQESRARPSPRPRKPILNPRELIGSWVLDVRRPGANVRTQISMSAATSGAVEFSYRAPKDTEHRFEVESFLDDPGVVHRTLLNFIDRVID